MRSLSLNPAFKLALTLPLIFGLGLGLGCDAEPEDEIQDGETTGEEDEALACVEDHSPAEGYGFETDNVDECPQPPGGGLECPPITPETIAAECDEDGSPCDPDAFITREAARCLAELEDFDAGLVEWRFDLIYHSGHQLPIWAVSNTTIIDEGDCREEGETLSFDAQTGELVELEQWLTIC